MVEFVFCCHVNILLIISAPTVHEVDHYLLKIEHVVLKVLIVISVLPNVHRVLFAVVFPKTKYKVLGPLSQHNRCFCVGSVLFKFVDNFDEVCLLASSIDQGGGECLTLFGLLEHALVQLVLLVDQLSDAAQNFEVSPLGSLA